MTRDKRAAPVHRRRHELRDRARLGRAPRLHGRAGGAGVRGRADPVRHARRRGRDRGRADQRRRDRARGDRRRRAGRHLRLRARRRRRRARRRRAARPVGPLRADRGRRDDRAGLSRRLLARADERAHLRPALAGRGGRRRERRLPLAARRARAAVREGVDRDRLEPPRRGARDRRVRDPAGAARRLVRLLPLARRAPSGSASCRSWRCHGSSRPATSPARARRWRSSRCRSGTRRRRCSTRSSTSSSPTAADFNDRFVEQLAFPGAR